MGSNQSAEVNPQEAADFDRLMQNVILSFDALAAKAACNETGDVESVHSAAVECMTKTQGSARHLMKQLDEMYLKGMPPERKLKCKEINRHWLDVLHRTLEFTPVMHHNIRDKMTAAHLMKLLHDALQKIPEPDDDHVPGDLRKLKEEAATRLKKSSDIAMGTFTALGQKYQELANMILEEICGLDKLAMINKNAKEGYERKRNAFICVGLVLLVVAVASGAYCAYSFHAAAVAKASTTTTAQTSAWQLFTSWLTGSDVWSKTVLTAKLNADSTASAVSVSKGVLDTATTSLASAEVSKASAAKAVTVANTHLSAANAAVANQSWLSWGTSWITGETAKLKTAVDSASGSVCTAKATYAACINKVASAKTCWATATANLAATQAAAATAAANLAAADAAACAATTAGQAMVYGLGAGVAASSAATGAMVSAAAEANARDIGRTWSAAFDNISTLQHRYTVLHEG